MPLLYYLYFLPPPQKKTWDQTKFYDLSYKADLQTLGPSLCSHSSGQEDRRQKYENCKDSIDTVTESTSKIASPGKDCVVTESKVHPLKTKFPRQYATVNPVCRVGEQEQSATAGNACPPILRRKSKASRDWLQPK